MPLLPLVALALALPVALSASPYVFHLPMVWRNQSFPFYLSLRWRDLERDLENAFEPRPEHLATISQEVFRLMSTDEQVLCGPCDGAEDGQSHPVCGSSDGTDAGRGAGCRLGVQGLAHHVIKPWYRERLQLLKETAPHGRQVVTVPISVPSAPGPGRGHSAVRELQLYEHGDNFAAAARRFCRTHHLSAAAGARSSGMKKRTNHYGCSPDTQLALMSRLHHAFWNLFYQERRHLEQQQELGGGGPELRRAKVAACTRHLNTFPGYELYTGYEQAGGESMTVPTVLRAAEEAQVEACVETGTYRGDTTLVLARSQLCEQVITIELSPKLAAAARKRFASESGGGVRWNTAAAAAAAAASTAAAKGDAGDIFLLEDFGQEPKSRAWPIKLLEGDSGIVLEQEEARFLALGPTLWFLDGHYSKLDTAQGVHDSPIMQELDFILGRRANRADVLVIDDARQFRGERLAHGFDYPELDDVLRKVCEHWDEFGRSIFSNRS